MLDLIEHWERYDISYAGLSMENPSAVMFDPKGDDRRLTSDKWVPVKTQEELFTLLGWIDHNVHFPPTLWRIIGPDGQLYGYMFTAWYSARIKVIDEKTLWVDDLPLPPFDHGPAGRI